MRKRAFLVLAIAGLGSLGARTGLAQDREIRIQAERLEADYAKHRATFSGRVKVQGAGFSIACASLFVAYAADGQVSLLKAEGGVAFTFRGATARAGTAEVDLTGRTVVLRGSPVLEKEGQTLAGDEIRIDMNNDRFQVLNAQGVFRLGKASP